MQTKILCVKFILIFAANKQNISGKQVKQVFSPSPRWRVWAGCILPMTSTVWSTNKTIIPPQDTTTNQPSPPPQPTPPYHRCPIVTWSWTSTVLGSASGGVLCAARCTAATSRTSNAITSYTPGRSPFPAATAPTGLVGRAYLKHTSCLDIQTC